MSTTLRFLFIYAAMIILGTQPIVRADILFNNFGEFDSFSSNGRLLQGPAVGSIGDVNQAAAFTTGSTGAILTNIQLGINCYGPGPATGPIDVVLAADAAGLPGVALQNSIVNVNSNGDQVISASYDGTLMLAPNTQYWIIADAEGTFDGSWRFNNIGDTGPTAGQSEGNPWSLHTLGGDYRYALRVQGRPVPEPSSFLLVTSALGGMLTLVRRRSPAR